MATAKERAAAAKARAAKAKQKAAQSSNEKGGGFINFIREQGIIGLAVGLAIGTVASGTVKALVNGFVNPIVQFIVGSQKGLETATWHVHLWGRDADFAWGAALSSLITLVATALVIYFIVCGAKLDRLDKKKG